MKADRQTVRVSCDDLLSQGFSLEEITKKAVTDKIGSQGNNKLVYQYINEWKSDISNGVDSEFDNIPPLLSQYLIAEKKKWNNKIKENEDTLLQKIQSLEQDLTKVNNEKNEAVAFRETFEKALFQFESTQDNLNKEISKLTDVKLKLSNENGSLKTSLHATSIHVQELKSEMEKARKTSQEQLIHLIEAHKQQHNNELNAHKEQNDIHKIEKRNVELKLEALQEKYTSSSQRLAQLTTLLETASINNGNLKTELKSLKNTRDLIATYFNELKASQLQWQNELVQLVNQSTKTLANKNYIQTLFSDNTTEIFQGISYIKGLLDKHESDTKE